VSPAGGLARRAHPFTLFAITGAIAALAFILPAPGGPVGLYVVVVVLAIAGGVGRSALRALLVCLPLWLLLFLLLAVLGHGSRADLGPVSVSRAGLAAALAQGARLGAVATASLALFACFDPSRFLDAVAARGWSFHAAYLLVATLQAAPRFRHRAAMILEAQRARGLRFGGGPIRRLRGLAPLTTPLVLGMLSEVDDRAMALETRGLDARVARTPLDPPADRAPDRLIRLGLPVLVVAALAWRLLR
jgi:energy-coupling factor transport system permease protein